MSYPIKSEYTNDKVNKRTFIDNPKVIKEFASWYKDVDIKDKPTLDNFFDISFRYQLSFWLQFLQSIGVYVACDRDRCNAVLLDLNLVHKLIIRQDSLIISIDVGDNIIDTYEDIIHKLIVLIDKPF